MCFEGRGVAGIVGVRTKPTGHVVFFLAAVLLVGLLAPLTAQAAIFKTVQTGSVTFSNSSAAQSVNLRSDTDITKAFVTCAYQTSVATARTLQTCELVSGSPPKVTITPGGATTSIVQWYVAEFESGVSVQRGTITFNGTSGTGLSQTQSLTTTVDATKSFTLVSTRTNLNFSNRDEQTTMRAVLASDGTGLTIDRTVGNTTDLLVHWQVVQMEGASVQRGTLCIGSSSCTGTANGSGAAEQDNTATLATAVDPCKTFLLLTREAGTTTTGVDSLYFVSADFSSAVTCGVTQSGLTFRRNNRNTTSTNDVSISYEAVTLSDGTAVRRGVQGALTAASNALITQTTSAFTAVDLTESVPLILVAGGGTAATDLTGLLWTANINATTTEQFARLVGTNFVYEIRYQAVQFFRCQNSPICSVAATQQSNNVTVTWSNVFQFTTNSGSTNTLNRCGNAACDALVLRAVNQVNTDAPVNGTNYALNATIGSSTVRFNGTGTSLTDSLAVDGTTYCYKVFAKFPTNQYVNMSSSSTCIASSEMAIAMKGFAWTYSTSGGSALRAPIPGVNLAANLTAATTRAFAGTNGNRVVILNSSTGAQVQSTSTAGAVQGYLTWVPMSNNTQAMIVTDQDGFVTAFNADTGALLWTRQPSSTTIFQAPASAQIATPLFFGYDATGTAAFNAFNSAFGGGDLIYVVTANTATTQKVYALKATDGTIQWTWDPQAAGFTMDIATVQPQVDYRRNRLYVFGRSTGGENSIFVLNTLTGALATVSSPGSNKFAPGDIQTAPTMSWDGTVLYCSTSAGKLCAIDLTTLQFKYQSSTLTLDSQIKGFVWEDIFYPIGRLYFATTSGLWCVNAAGSDVNTASKCTDWGTNPVSVSGEILTQPYLGWSNLFSASDKGSVYAFKLYGAPTDGGTQVGTKAVESSTVQLGSPGGELDADGLVSALYVGAANGRIYKVGLTASEDFQ